MKEVDWTLGCQPDNSQFTEQRLKQVDETVSNVKQREGFFGIDLSKLTSWLASITGLRQPFVVFTFFIFFSIITCCCILCAPLCRSAISSIPRPPTGWSNAKICAQQQNEYFHMKLSSQIQDRLNEQWGNDGGLKSWKILV